MQRALTDPNSSRSKPPRTVRSTSDRRRVLGDGPLQGALRVPGAIDPDDDPSHGRSFLDHSSTMTAVSIPNMAPSVFLTWLRMWQCQTQVPGWPSS